MGVVLRRLGLWSSSVAVSVVVGCAGPTPTRGKLADARATQPAIDVVTERGMAAAVGVSTEALQKAYQDAGSPTIGFIRDRYQLPIANPLGAARIIEGNVLGMPFQQSVVAPSTERPFSIEPIQDGFEVQQLALVQQDLAAAGVRFTEVSAADANRIVAAEKQAIEQNGRVQWNEMTPSGAAILVSFQRSTGLGGPIFIVRVVRMKDGALLALRTGPAQGGAVALRPLLSQSIHDGLVAAARYPTP
jgi:hypothetical protein